MSEATDDNGARRAPPPPTPHIERETGDCALKRGGAGDVRGAGGMCGVGGIMGRGGCAGRGGGAWGGAQLASCAFVSVAVRGGRQAQWRPARALMRAGGVARLRASAGKRFCPQGRAEGARRSGSLIPSYVEQRRGHRDEFAGRSRCFI